MSSTLVFIVSITGAALALIIVQQWFHIQALIQEKGLQEHGLTSQKKPQFDAFLTESPFPLCIVDQGGTIMWGTSRFWQHIDPNHSHSLANLDQELGSSLQDMKTNQVTASHYHLTVRSQDPEDSMKRRLYTVVTWPYQNGRTRGSIFCFFEQTAAHQRQLSSAAFENQLIRYLDELSANLSAIAKDPRSVSQKNIQLQADEAHKVVEYLGEMHHPMRRQQAHEKVNIATICKECLHDERIDLQKHKIHVVNTLPHSCAAYGNDEEFKLVFHLILEAIKELAGDDQELRVHLRVNGQHVTLSFHLPDVIVEQEWLHHLFGFGKKQGPLVRFNRLKLALAQQIALKYHGHISASSAEHLGTVFELVFANAEREVTPSNL